MNLTDNEIIKALENCVSDCPSCTTCPYDEGTFMPHECMAILMNDVFNLINRQKAEIERLQKSIENQIAILKKHNIVDFTHIFDNVEKLEPIPIKDVRGD